MNSVIQQLCERKSVRAFTDREIPSDCKNEILQAATQAPTAGNQQLYTILDITDQSLKDQLAESCDHQSFIAKAKIVLIFCADCQKWYDAFKAVGADPRPPAIGDLLLAASDANIAAQNAVTAAHSLGVGSCYIGDIMEKCEFHRSLLHLPEYVVPVAMLVFGYPTKQQKDRQKPKRADIKHIVHKNSYRHMDVAELEKMLLPRCQNKGYEEWVRTFCERKYNSDFSVEMSRSVEKYLQSFFKKS